MVASGRGGGGPLGPGPSACSYIASASAATRLPASPGTNARNQYPFPYPGHLSSSVHAGDALQGEPHTVLYSVQYSKLYGASSLWHVP